MAGLFTQEFPGGSYSDDTLRIHITARRANKQNLNPKLANHILYGEKDYEWSMIAPTDIQENITHTYEEYHSIQGRVAAMRQEFMRSIGKMMDAGESGGDRETGDTAAGQSIVDSPLVYAGSERREYSFTFLLMQYNHIDKDVYEPIRAFRKYSSASIDNASADTIRFPHVFTVVSKPLPFITIPYSVLTNVQVVYNAPYKRGYPQRAELTLTFKDIRPLYQSSWEDQIESKVTAEIQRTAFREGDRGA